MALTDTLFHDINSLIFYTVNNTDQWSHQILTKTALYTNKYSAKYDESE